MGAASDVTRRWRATLLMVAWTAVGAGGLAPPALVCGESAIAPPRPPSLLDDAGLSAADLAAFQQWNGELTSAQADIVGRLLYRQEQAELARRPVEAALLADSPSSTPPFGELGQASRIEGHAVAVLPLALPESARQALERDRLWQCEVRRADDSVVVVIAGKVPAAWTERPAAAELREPVVLDGVLLGAAIRGGESAPLVAASRLQWRPTTGVSSGMRWLAKHGYDVALLDEVRHNRAFVKPHDGLESRAFYEGLRIVSQAAPGELTALVRRQLPQDADAARQVAAAAAAERREKLAERSTAPPDRQPMLNDELKHLERRQAIAARVAERAAKGVSSVWPMFLEPQGSAGELFLIEGVARRAVRIEVDEATAESEMFGWPGDLAALEAYYEIDVFTTDGQNQPVICCVVRLPAGFPTGELIREPVRVAGVFFKKWAYARRSEGAAAAAPRGARTAAPLLIAAEVEWLATAPPTGPSVYGLWGGGAFLALVALVWLVVARGARRDQLARERRARYDAPRDVAPEP